MAEQGKPAMGDKNDADQKIDTVADKANRAADKAKDKIDKAKDMAKERMEKRNQ
jgi:hypothetical protein